MLIGRRKRKEAKIGWGTGGKMTNTLANKIKSGSKKKTGLGREQGGRPHVRENRKGA